MGGAGGGLFSIIVEYMGFVTGSCYFVLVVLLVVVVNVNVVVVAVVVLFLSQLFLCLSIYLSFNNCCGCGGCGAGCGCGCGCGCCGCGCRHRRRLPSKGRVGCLKKSRWGVRPPPAMRAMRLAPRAKPEGKGMKKTHVYKNEETETYGKMKATMQKICFI